MTQDAGPAPGLTPGAPLAHGGDEQPFSCTGVAASLPPTTELIRRKLRLD